MTLRGKYSFLSNMHAASFTWDGRTYMNSEAAFQSAKSLDPAVRDAFSAMNGVTAKRAGRKVELRGDWDAVKLDVMEEILRAKFSQNPELLQKLIDTGDMVLMEGNYWHDTYWGVDIRSGAGENHLGEILMKLRAELEALPAYDFTGMEMDTRAFGRVKILCQEGNRLKFEANGGVKAFSLPGCIVNGFLIPSDAGVVESFLRRQAREERLRSLEKNGLPAQASGHDGGEENHG